MVVRNKSKCRICINLSSYRPNPIALTADAGYDNPEGDGQWAIGFNSAGYEVFLNPVAITAK